MSRTRKERQRSREKTALIVAVAAWAVLVGTLLTTEVVLPDEEGSCPTQQENAPETQETAIVEIPEEPVTVIPVMEKLPQIENATLTHYCICKICCSKDPSHPAYGITASGREAEPYVSVAVDPFMIPLGSTVYVDYGDGEIQTYRADDTGSSITGAKLDLCVSSHEEALELGVKTVRVWWSE